MPRDDGDGFMTRSSEVRKEGKFRGLMNRLRKEKNAEFHNCLVIGLDFGTTYSGASWITMADFGKDDINIITRWPGTTHEEAKTPTRLYYEFEGDAPLWGFEVPAHLDAIEWFKLLLLRDEDMWDSLRASDHIMRARRMLRESRKTAQDCVADYLRALWEHTISEILKVRKKYLIEALQFHVVLTVPAIWKDYARTSMTEAARKAGILDPRRAGETTLTFAPEPEAAALSSLIERMGCLDDDDVYLICDAGGGTVDVITYKIGSTMPLRLHEAVEGAGSVCGGIFIDEDFKIQLRNRLGRKFSMLSAVDINRILKAEWEYSIKPQYSKRNGKAEYLVSLNKTPLTGADLNDTRPGLPPIRDGYIRFSNSNIGQAFTNTAVPGLEKLLDSQIKKAKNKGLKVEGIILAGGLGSSRFLYEHLEQRYSGGGIEIWQSTPDRTRTAICRGAILKGLMDAPLENRVEDYSTPSVLSTISRVSLGIRANVPWDPSIHSKKDKWYYHQEGTYKAKRNGLNDSEPEVDLPQGEDVAKAHPIRKEYYSLYEDEDELKADDFNITIYQYDGDSPPVRWNERLGELCKITGKLWCCEYSELKDFRGKGGKWYKRLDYALEMVPSGASTLFTIYYGETKIGSGQAEIQYQ